MITFSIATNWDDSLIREIDIFDLHHQVVEIFGKLASDFIGGGRPTYALPNPGKRNASHHIELVKKTGRKFNYLLNASCLDNREFTRSGQREIRKLLSWLDSLGVDGVTVASPYLAHFIRRNYPRFELTVSVIALVDSIGKVKFWIGELEADKITLYFHRVNRDFPLLKKIRSVTNCELQLIANETCLYDCPFSIFHRNFSSHASQTDHPLRGFGIDWYTINCRYRLFTHPEEFIKSNWIRPEDVRYYERVGIDSLKLLDRTRDTQNIIFTLKAYIERKFNGNLIDLLFYMNKLPKKGLFLKSLKFFCHPLYVNVFKLSKIKNLFSDIGIYVDNQKLNGFLEYFFNGKCKFDNCDECGYCRSVAERVVNVDNAWKEKAEKIYKEIIESLNSGDMFKYF